MAGFSFSIRPPDPQRKNHQYQLNFRMGDSALILYLGGNRFKFRPVVRCPKDIRSLPQSLQANTDIVSRPTSCMSIPNQISNYYHLERWHTLQNFIKYHYLAYSFTAVNNWNPQFVTFEVSSQLKIQTISIWAVTPYSPVRPYVIATHLLLLQLYNSIWVLACSIISFHCFLSCALCFQFFTPIWSLHIRPQNEDASLNVRAHDRNYNGRRVRLLPAY
jgi:hypothetical protein